MTPKVPSSAADFLPARRTVRNLAGAAQDCRGCELYEDATQTVFGSGPAHAELMLIGEQPGDVEDRAGVPFVGPAGKLLRHGLVDVGLDPDAVFMTNAVKHFRWRADERSKRRLHEKPSSRHIAACRPWVTAELAAVSPRVVVVLGATAAASVLGPDVKVTKVRGQIGRFPGAVGELRSSEVLVTVHPSAILRSRDRTGDYDRFVADLQVAADVLGSAR